MKGRRWKTLGLHGPLARMILFVVTMSALAYPLLGARSAWQVAAKTVPTRTIGAARPATLNIPYGEDDQTIIMAMPDLDLAAIMAAESPLELPRLDFTDVLGRGAVPASDVADVRDVVGDIALPDTLLLWSGDWFGPKLHRAAEDLGVQLSADQWTALESIAVARSVNTRMLLTLAAIKSAPTRYTTSADMAQVALPRIVTHARCAPSLSIGRSAVDPLSRRSSDDDGTTCSQRRLLGAGDEPGCRRDLR